MRLNMLMVVLVAGVICTYASAAPQVTSPLEMIRGNNPDERVQGFYDLVKLDSVPGRITFGCEFSHSDISVTKKDVVELLRREKVFDFNGYYAKRYGVDYSRKEIYSHRKEKKVKDYLYAMEGYGAYLADLAAFVDSCEDESAIDLFPGEHTFKKYPQKSVDMVTLKFDNAITTGRRLKEGAYLVSLMGNSAKQFRDADDKSYDKVKLQLIKLADDTELGNVAVTTMGELGDQTFIPVLEKISTRDSSHGKAIGTDVTGKKRIRPISEEAKKSLEKIRKLTGR